MNDYVNASSNIDLDDEETDSENAEGELVFCSEEDSSTDTDIDVIVEEYREGLKVIIKITTVKTLRMEELIKVLL